MKLRKKVLAGLLGAGAKKNQAAEVVDLPSRC